MRLFTIGSDFQVEINKEWIMLIPEFEALWKRDKGSKKDYRGDKKLKFRKELTFIYFDLDFASPLRTWEDYERREEAMKYAGLEESDIDAAVMAAHARYDILLQKSSRALRSLRSAYRGLDSLDAYFESINLAEKDKKGELVHNPKQYMESIKNLQQMYDSLEKFEKRVEEQLAETPGIRGSATLGGKEGTRQKDWGEGQSPVSTERAPTTSMKEVASMLHGDDDEDVFDDENDEE